MDILEILTSTKTIAVIGASKNPKKPSRSVMRYLRRHGYICYPVNPTATEIAGLQAYKSIVDIPDTIDVADVFLPPAVVMNVIDDIIKKKVKVLWLQEGIINEKAAALAKKSGITVIMDKCMMKEHVRLRREGKIKSEILNIERDY